ncbi:hypothetical protein TNCV_669791 [Trichonephila clavipes]|nr:hypothetical protein TNCV_669791 [Trichonephila clavipes]
MATPFDDMDLSPVPSRPNTPNIKETPCQRPERTRVMIKRFTTTRDGYKLILDSPEKEDSLYVKILNEHHEITTLLDNVASDFGAIPRCTPIGCPIHS